MPDESTVPEQAQTAPASVAPATPTPAAAPSAIPATAASGAPTAATPAGATAVAAPPKPAAAPAKPVELAPEGMDCPHCKQRLRLFARYARSVEYCCPSLKEETPVLADKYAEWRDLFLKSRVSKPL